MGADSSVSRSTAFGVQSLGFVAYAHDFVSCSGGFVLQTKKGFIAADGEDIAALPVVHKNQDTKKPPCGGWDEALFDGSHSTQTIDCLIQSAGLLGKAKTQ